MTAAMETERAPLVPFLPELLERYEELLAVDIFFFLYKSKINWLDSTVAGVGLKCVLCIILISLFFNIPKTFLSRCPF